MKFLQYYPPFYIINLFAPIFVGSISVLFIIKLPSSSILLFFIFLRFVLRGGEWGEISSEDLVPGDVVSLKAIVQKKQSKNYRFYDFLYICSFLCITCRLLICLLNFSLMFIYFYAFV